MVLIVVVLMVAVVVIVVVCLVVQGVGRWELVFLIPFAAISAGMSLKFQTRGFYRNPRV